MQWPWRRAERELDAEVRYHLDALAEEFERQGCSRAEAMRRARREFGGVEQVKEECRDVSGWRWAREAAQDVRFGWRMMKKTPAISIAAVATLALGIGATTAILTLADTILWRRLPVPAPEQLSEIFWFAQAHPGDLNRGASGSAFRDGALRVADFFSFQAYRAMRDGARGKAQIAGHLHIQRVSAAYGGQVHVADLRAVTGNFFQVLGLGAAAGRVLQDSDEAGDATPAVVITHRYWQARLSGAREAVGSG